MTKGASQSARGRAEGERDMQPWEEARRGAGGGRRFWKAHSSCSALWDTGGSSSHNSCLFQLARWGRERYMLV